MPLGENRSDQFSPYLRALHQEIIALGKEWLDRPIRTVFLGGGTPSLLTPKELGEVFDCVRQYWEFVDDAEITIEINPDTMTPEKAQGYLDVGVNRASMGVQSLNPEGLKLLGRFHSVDRAKRCYETLRDAGFSNVSCDMIYGWPGQTVEGWSQELTELLTWGTDHLSLYELILERGTPMTRAVNKGELVLPSEEESLEMFRVTRSITQDVGMQWYEISNYAQPGRESRHNVDNWRGSDYLGVGPGAHSFRALPELGARRANPRNMPKYLEQPTASPWNNRSREEVVTEAMMFGLRLREGWTPQLVEQLYGMELYEPLVEASQPLVEDGLLLEPSDRFQLTERGAEVLDEVVGFLVSALESTSSILQVDI